MPKLTVEGHESVEVPANKRLVNALVDDAKIDQLHSCGGKCCTTCRVEFIDGEPQKMTRAEKDVLTFKSLIGLPGLRLSCQIVCDHDMTVRAISRFEGSGKKDSGARPTDDIEPPAVWVEK